jgi:hypothetical protein
MSNECLEHHSQYIYSSSAYALAGEFYRPTRKSVSVQGGTVLGASGGYHSQRVGKYSADDLVSFESAQVEVGGSYDKCHDVQTTYFTSLIEGLNIANMVTADRVVAYTMVYSPSKDHDGDHTFNINGSYFDNLRIAGRKIDINLNTSPFHGVNSYSNLIDRRKEMIAKAQAKKVREKHRLKPGKKEVEQKADEQKNNGLFFLDSFSSLPEEDLQKLERKYHPLQGLSRWVDDWKADDGRNSREHYLCSAANHLQLEQQVGADSQKGFEEDSVKNYGGVICIPKFGVVRLAEVLVSRRSRRLTMLTVQMGSVASGTVTVGDGSPGGGNGLP